MQRTPVNPWPWSLKLGYNQAEILQGSSRQLVCAGQTAVDAMGAPQHPQDMRGQLALALNNLEIVLNAAEMRLADITRLSIFTTDVDAALQNFDLLGQRFGPLGAAPPMTLLGVTRLAMPQLMIELEATAAA
ncbi:MAG: Rid family hydrolase [Pseudomonadota bacterium]